MLDAHVPAKLLWVIPDFVDCRHFDPAAVTTEREPRPTVLSVGRMTREKGHTVLVRAMLIVAKAIPEVRLLVCGQGEREADLKKQTETEGLSEAVTFLGFAPDVRPSLNASDVFVMPSLSEGLGVAAIEAMAMAKPVVASRVGGLPESVVDGETGLLVPPGDGPALAAAIIALLRNSDLAQAMGRAGRQRALAQFDRGRVLDRVLALYHEVMAEG
jgi:glycosyltransferase involved in cell wall biosynthesis